MITTLKNIFYVMLLLALLTSVNGCYYDVNEELYPVTKGTLQCDTTNSTYSAKVLTIIQNNCYSCHTGSAPSANINLQGYANLKVYADNGKLIGTIKHETGFSPMPFGGSKLNSCDIDAVQRWINNGALNN